MLDFWGVGTNTHGIYFGKEDLHPDNLARWSYTWFREPVPPYRSGKGRGIRIGHTSYSVGLYRSDEPPISRANSFTPEDIAEWETLASMRPLPKTEPAKDD